LEEQQQKITEILTGISWDSLLLPALFRFSVYHLTLFTSLAFLISRNWAFRNS